MSNKQCLCQTLSWVLLVPCTHCLGCPCPPAHPSTLWATGIGAQGVLWAAVSGDSGRSALQTPAIPQLQHCPSPALPLPVRVTAWHICAAAVPPALGLVTRRSTGHWALAPRDSTSGQPFM